MSKEIEALETMDDFSDVEYSSSENSSIVSNASTSLVI